MGRRDNLLCCCHHAWTIVPVHLLHAMNAEQHQVAADLWTKPISLAYGSSWLACRQPVNYTHHCHLLYSVESWYSFYHLTEGRRLSWRRWLATYRDCLPARIQVLVWPVDRDQHGWLRQVRDRLVMVTHRLHLAMFDNKTLIFNTDIGSRLQVFFQFLTSTPLGVNLQY